MRSSSSKLSHLAALYAVVVSTLGPQNLVTASCAFKLPISQPKTKHIISLVIISIYAFMIVSLSALLIIHIRLAKRNCDAAHTQFIMTFQRQPSDPTPIQCGSAYRISRHLPTILGRPISSIRGASE